MGKYYPESWEGLFAQKEQALRDNGCQEALDIASFDELQTSLHIIAQEYGDSGFPDIIARLQPGFRYLDSFTTAITSATQYDPRACLVWGVLQAFIQVREYDSQEGLVMFTFTFTNHLVAVCIPVQSCLE
jgi:hypothetical protein